MATRKASPWAYQVDYDKEIANDEAEIARCTRALELGLHKLTDDGYGWSLADLCIVSTVEPQNKLSEADIAHARQVVERLGLSRVDIANLAAYVESNVPIANEAQTGWYALGQMVHSRLLTEWPDDLMSTAERLRLRLKQAKAALARHRRNKVKFATK